LGTKYVQIRDFKNIQGIQARKSGMQGLIGFACAGTWDEGLAALVPMSQ
jgi:hypothetical protein